ncbi:MAG TPA: bluetail domain-containing putative surface protein [Rhizomicrobium sp.]|jgi:Ca2+-binding RTX toxin-like protein|nr:bluetail domain-containing putative surface protein [Rhizomicrobium sp.]
MAFYDITSNVIAVGTSGIHLAPGDFITIEAGITLESDKTPNGYVAGDRSPIRSDGGGNITLVNHGTLGGGYSRGFTNFFSGGGCHLINAADGTIITQNACFEMQDAPHTGSLGNNYVENDGYMRTEGVGICIGGNPRGDYGTFGDNDIVNIGTLISTQIDAIRVDGGGNTITNSGDIENTRLREAIWFSSKDTNDANTLTNSGTIEGGHAGVAILFGAAAGVLNNTGTITGDVQFSDLASTYHGGGVVIGMVIGGAGNDVFLGGAGVDNLRGQGGSDVLQGEKGNDILAGGEGADTLLGGLGNDTFVFTGANRSYGDSYDTIIHFNANQDYLNVTQSIGHLDQIATGTLNAATLDADLANSLTLHAGHAAVFTPDAGDLAGHVFLVIDGNGVAGYQAEADMVIDITGFKGTITTADFT